MATFADEIEEFSGRRLSLFQKALGEDFTQPQTILVTGASGFVGGKISLALSELGHRVVAVGRNPYAVWFKEKNVDFVRLDIADSDAVQDEFSKNPFDAVIHCAALSVPNASLTLARSINVEGTRNVASAARSNDVKRFVHVSSTAVFFDFRNRWNVGDQDELARRFSCNYATTKSESESVIGEEVSKGLNAVTIRARAVFGPGDNQLIPRIIDAANEGALKIVGDGKNKIDMTFVDNLVYGVFLALSCASTGGVYTITNDEPVELWPTIEKVLKEIHVGPEKLNRIPYPIAFVAGGLSESFHRVLRNDQDPKLSRYAVGLLAKNQTFDISHAKKELGYRPIVSMESGLKRTTHDLKEQLDFQNNFSHDQSVSFSVFSTGYTTAKEQTIQHGGGKQIVKIHSTFVLVRHPQYGLVLFDTGYGPRFHEATKRFPYSLYAKVTPTVVQRKWSAVERLKNVGVDAKEINRIVISHFHADHVCGLRDFRNADFICSEKNWRSVRGRRGLSAVRRAFLPQLLPDDIEQRLFPIRNFHGPRIGELFRCHDLFRDGAIRLVELPGHASGQLGMLLRTERRYVFLIADAVWTLPTITENLPLTWAFKQLADSPKQAEMTRQKLARLCRQHSNVELMPTHCPSVIEKYGLESSIESDSSKLPSDRNETKETESRGQRS